MTEVLVILIFVGKYQRIKQLLGYEREHNVWLCRVTTIFVEPGRSQGEILNLRFYNRFGIPIFILYI